MACAEEELCWFRQLGRVAANVASRVRPTGSTISALGPLRYVMGGDRSQWRSFDLADAMEQGLAQEMTTAFVTPPGEDAETQTLLVVPSEDRLEYALMSQEGEAVLLARVNKEGKKGDNCKVDIYVPAGGDPPVAVGPAFTLSPQSATHNCEWRLTSDRCECCEYLPSAQACCSKICQRELLHVRHIREEIGRGLIMTMEVDMPALRADGTPDIWCARRGGSSTQDKICLESRRPRWSSRLKSLTLDFYGRCSMASAKNFQLQAKGSRSKEAELLFGKVADDTYVLDYKHPLGMVQAFAIALTTRSWH
mmetsp:Transcript_83762/g.237570  ORF Transcript_83762/g.237570 Transcript_83762/m.237570 type:complete len:308 (-) Transcript_83762:138-1061(-)